MAGINGSSMRDVPLPTTFSERYRKHGLIQALRGLTPQEELLQQAYSQFREGVPAQPGTTVGAGPLEGGFVPTGINPLAEQTMDILGFQTPQRDVGGTPEQPAGDPMALIQNLISAGPEGQKLATDLMSSLGMGKGQASQGAKFFGSVQYATDPEGNLIPYLISKEGNAVPVPLEQLGEGYRGAVPTSTVQTTGGKLVQVPSKGTGGRTPVTTEIGLSAPATAGESKQTAQQEVALNMADRMRSLVENDMVSVGPVSGRKMSVSAATGVGLNESEAELLSLSENYSNQLIQAMRGAQVGPKEQVMFNKSLPRVNQPKELFLKNLEITQKNLRMLNKRLSKMRPTPELKDKKPKVDAVYDPKTGQFRRPK